MTLFYRGAPSRGSKGNIYKLKDWNSPLGELCSTTCKVKWLKIFPFSECDEFFQSMLRNSLFPDCLKSVQTEQSNKGNETP